MTKDKNMPDSAFISRMEFLAQKAGSVNALAKKAGLSQGGIRRYFSGGEPSRPQLVALAKAGDVSVSWLICGEEHEQPKAKVVPHLPNPSMRELAQWIAEQNDGVNYWEVAKAKMALEYPEFKEWLKKRAEQHNSDKSQENKSVNNW